MSKTNKYELTLPKMGESVEEATIVNWLKNVGDDVKIDDFIVEIATDKVDSEVPSDVDGKIIELCFKVNDVVKVGETICIIELSNESSSAKTIDIIEEIPNIDLVLDDKNDEKIETNEILKPSKIENDIYISPLVRSIAEKENINEKELLKISGSGKDGRITKKDILKYIESSDSISEKLEIDKNYSDNQSTIRDLTRMEKILAEHMVNSKKTAPHVQSFIEIDVTNLWDWREGVKNDFQKRENYKLTLTHVFVKIVSEVLREFPILNSSLKDDKVFIKSDINIGVATALSDGNLIVPVLKNSDQLSLIGIVKKTNDLVQRARNNNLNPDDVVDGTYTITNVGVFDTLAGIPIINQPQVGILAIGSILKKPSVIETEKGDFIGIRRKMILCHSYDHRIINGATGGLFIKRIKDIIEGWNPKTQI
ncbi:MAG: dihydrolipoamide acetyltransferase family protein [Bacteroidota bacterium]|nr:dihydrolipoamide acetyltransferase family protein [Bacteroidota bacterium]